MYILRAEKNISVSKRVSPSYLAEKKFHQGIEFFR